MPRLVPATVKLYGLEGGDRSDSNWLERVAKYIPGEIIAAFKGCFAILTLVPNDDPKKVPIGWIASAICAVFTPIYFCGMNKLATAPLQGWKLYIQLIIVTVSFAVWAYALGGPFAMVQEPILWGGYAEWLGGIILILYTLGVGAYKP